MDHRLGWTINGCCLFTRQPCSHSLSPHTSVLGIFLKSSFTYLTGRQKERTCYITFASVAIHLLLLTRASRLIMLIYQQPSAGLGFDFPVFQ